MLYLDYIPQRSTIWAGFKKLWESQKLFCHIRLGSLANICLILANKPIKLRFGLLWSLLLPKIIIMANRVYKIILFRLPPSMDRLSESFSFVPRRLLTSSFHNSCMYKKIKLCMYVRVLHRRRKNKMQHNCRSLKILYYSDDDELSSLARLYRKLIMFTYNWGFFAHTKKTKRK